MKQRLEGMKVLQQSQILDIQQKLAHAGIRNKELAVSVIGARMVLPIVLGILGVMVIYVIDYFADWGGLKRVGSMGVLLFLGYKGLELYLMNLPPKRKPEISQGLHETGIASSREKVG